MLIFDTRDLLNADEYLELGLIACYSGIYIIVLIGLFDDVNLVTPVI